jgi:hypothetical protein
VAVHRHAAFGLRWDSDIALEQFALAADDRPTDIVVRRAEGPLPARDEILNADGACLCADGIRFWATDEATFDIYPPGRIDWRPGAGWKGRFPPLFYGTLTALLLAWRGGAPIHGSSVEIGGRAWLICGESGAGKSTLAAALVASGAARLIADDLSVLEAGADGSAMLYAGRPAIRLFPGTAANMAATSEIREEPGMDKLLALPPRTDPFTPVRLAGIIFLGSDVNALPAWRRGELLAAQQFRPLWMQKIPGSQDRFRRLHRAATGLPMLAFDSVEIRDADSFRARADRILAGLSIS